MNDNIVKEVTHAGKRVQVLYDPEPLNPRKEYDNATIMVHWHPRYDLGDKRIERASAYELASYYDDILIVLPMVLHDHSGLSISCGPCVRGWDSGQVGWVFITAAKAEEMGYYGYAKEQLEEVIKSEIKTYDSYLRGEVYGYQVIGRDGDILESCWGFIGDMEDCLAEGKSVAKGCEDPAVAREAEELANRATYAGV